MALIVFGTDGAVTGLDTAGTSLADSLLLGTLLVVATVSCGFLGAGLADKVTATGGVFFFIGLTGFDCFWLFVFLACFIGALHWN